MQYNQRHDNMKRFNKKRSKTMTKINKKTIEEYLKTLTKLN